MKKLIALLRDRQRLNAIFFGEDDRWSKKVEIFILTMVVLCLLLESIESAINVEDYSFDALRTAHLTHKGVLKTIIIVLEYVFTLIFAIEYTLRAYCANPRREYTLSFFGIIDALATWPTVLSIFFPQLRYFTILRTFRLIRIFKVFKLFTFINEGYLLLESIRRSMTKIVVYFLFVLVLVCILGTLMYIVESDEAATQFTSIPTSIYWAIVTLTTVGYGDITPITPLGQFFSSMVMILGYTIIAIPTGIVSATIIDTTQKRGHKNRCPRCNQKTDLSANYCKHCGEKL